MYLSNIIRLHEFAGASNSKSISFLENIHKIKSLKRRYKLSAWLATLSAVCAVIRASGGDYDLLPAYRYAARKARLERSIEG